MIDAAIIDGFVDEHARALTRHKPALAPEIARRTMLAKERIAKLALPVDGVPSFGSVSGVFDVCEALDDLLATDDETLSRHVSALRADAMCRMLDAFYERKAAADPSRGREIGRQERIATLLAEAIPLMRKTMPLGMFGPEWFEEHCAPDVYEEFLAYAYSFEDDRLDWTKVRELLPATIRAQFDPIDNSDVPKEVETMADALAVLAMFQRRGYGKNYLLDPANLSGHLETQPHFRSLIEFFARRSDEAADGVSPGSPTA